MDLLKKEFDYPEEDEDVNIRGYKLMGKANESQVKKVAEAIKGAKKPVILAGGGEMCIRDRCRYDRCGQILQRRTFFGNLRKRIFWKLIKIESTETN